MAERKIHLLILIVDIEAGTGLFCRSVGMGLRRHFGDEFTVSLLTLRDRQITDEDRAAFDQVHALSRRVHSNWRRFYQTPLDALRVRRALRRINPDVIFAVGTYSNLLASMLAPKAPILSEHMNMSLRLQAAPFAGIMRRLMRWRYSRNLIVAAARGITDDLERNFGATRTLVIPNGLDLERIRARAGEEAPALPTDRPYFIAVGRLTAQKDYPTLLRAFAAAREKHLPEHLLIAGDGELLPALKELAAALGIADSVHFLGHRPNPYPLIQRARALVLTSMFEGFAYVPIEAMALGVPVIATDCPSGPAEILGQGRFGLLAPVGDVPAIAAALLELSNSPAAQRAYAQQARNRAEQLSLEHMARAYRDLFVQAAQASLAASPSPCLGEAQDPALQVAPIRQPGFKGISDHV